jgi:hypothetical protein
MKMLKMLTLTMITLLIVSLTVFLSPKIETTAQASPNASAVFSLVKSGTVDTLNWTLGPIPEPIGTTFTVDLRIDNATNVWAWSIGTLNWSSSAFVLTKVTQGSYLKNTNPQTTFLGSQSSLIDNVNGGLMRGLVCTLPNDYVATDSSGILATFTFTVIGSGKGNITMSLCDLRSETNDDIGFTPNSNNATVYVISYGALSPGKLDVITNKGGSGIGINSSAFCPGELLTLNSRVTFSNASVEGIEVAFFVGYNDTVFNLRVAKTNATGYAVTECRLPYLGSITTEMICNWSITAVASVAQERLSDQVFFSFLAFDNIAGVQLTPNVHNSDNFTITIPASSFADFDWAELDISLFDSANMPIGFCCIINGTDPIVNGTFSKTIEIIDSAFT